MTKWESLSLLSHCCSVPDTTITIPGYVLFPPGTGGDTVVSHSQEGVALGVLNIDSGPHEVSWLPVEPEQGNLLPISLTVVPKLRNQHSSMVNKEEAQRVARVQNVIWVEHFNVHHHHHEVRGSTLIHWKVQKGMPGAHQAYLKMWCQHDEASKQDYLH
eukprot:g17936.t1